MHVRIGAKDVRHDRWWRIGFLGVMLAIAGLLSLSLTHVGSVSASAPTPGSNQAGPEQLLSNGTDGQKAQPGHAQAGEPANPLSLQGAILNTQSTGEGASQPGAVPPDAPECSPDWAPVTTPNLAFKASILSSVASVSSNDVWAGGWYGSDEASSRNVPVFEHWDGTEWTPVAAALPVGAEGGEIWDISVNSANDVWAVGHYTDGVISKTLIERWNGIQWNAVAGVDLSATYNALYGVSVVSTNNVWAVGHYVTGGVYTTLILHWDGTTWTQVTSPTTGTGDNYLQDVSVVPGSGGSDIWAVGYYEPSPGASTRTLTLHYNGTTWTRIPSLNQGANDNVLNGVHAVAANDVWAVGGYVDGTLNRTLAQHWDGSAWSIVPTVDPSAQGQELLRVFATGANDVWATGRADSGMAIVSTLIEHWNGSAWSVSTNTGPGVSNLLYGISGTAPNDIWAVGGSDASASAIASDVFISHYTGAVWSQIYAPNPPINYNILYSISALSATDIWAVGYVSGYIGSSNTQRMVILHWDGSTWSIPAITHPGTDGDALYSVKAVSANDVWAVGTYGNGTNSQTLIMHWNGSNWSQVTSPNPGGNTHNHSLLDIDAAGPNDIWAVGNYDDGVSIKTLTLHWNGATWLQVASPNPGTNFDTLTGVTVVPGSGGNDVWATGYYRENPADDDATLFLRWNGTMWSHVSSPSIGGVDNQPFRIYTISANDVWAAGSTTSPTNEFQGLAMHWNGATWSISTVPQPSAVQSQLFGVDATAANDVYITGGYINAASQPISYILHWDGSTWTTLPNVENPGNGSALTDIEIVSPTDMWAVGGYNPTGFDQAQALVEHYAPCVDCAIEFSDVPEGSTFYDYIHCLACQNIVGGYGDGTFRPNNPVTRGQLSKIVANSAGFAEAQNVQMFEDVPVGSTFQVFAGRLASRGHISGYPCGGPDEPCGPNNLPYFRPNNNATRGQISKIVSNAAGFNDSPSGQQFEDVPAGSTYYIFAYRLASRNIMSGYPCGGPGEPCGVGNLPYFRPNFNATRGQTSKITAGAFFPSCVPVEAVK